MRGWERQRGKCGGKEASRFLSPHPVATGKLFKFSEVSVSLSQNGGVHTYHRDVLKTESDQPYKRPAQSWTQRRYLINDVIVLLLLPKLGLRLFTELYLLY